MANVPEKYKNESDGELTNEKGELREIIQDTERYKNHVERISNHMENDDASKHSSETYASVVKKDLRSKPGISKQKSDDEKDRLKTGKYAIYGEL